MSSLLEAALMYAEARVPLFPVHTVRDGVCSCGSRTCKKAGKHPMTSHGHKDATVDPAIITTWWTRWPSANIGMPTGHASGFVVLDIDGEEGEATLAAFEGQFGALPPTPSVRTPRGWHRHYSATADMGPVPSVARGGLDVRGDGGYVILPPSRRGPSELYEWDYSVKDIAPLPASILAYARGQISAAAVNNAKGDARTSVSSHLTRSLSGVHTRPEFSPAEEARIRSALAFIPSQDRDVWLRVGMALHWTGWGEPAFQIWNEWSRGTPEKYNEADQLKTWQSFKETRDA